MRFGKALKILRSIKELHQSDVAAGVFMEERTYREIESDRRAMSAKEVILFAEFYKIDIQLIYDIAMDTIPLQNIVHEAKRDGIVINNVPSGESTSELVSYLLQRIKDLEQHISDLSK
jgi:transcriptional regulator with XRE-family HTH domain